MRDAGDAKLRVVAFQRPSRDRTLGIYVSNRLQFPPDWTRTEPGSSIISFRLHTTLLPVQVRVFVVHM